ncbi:MAG: multidrug efflux system membrane fusion protein [Halieaceae bacterium]|jgi:multidrug efflux system membrane fusion protein
MKKNLITASLIGAALLLWLLSGLFIEEGPHMADTTAPPAGDGARELTRVRVTQMNAEQRTLTRILRGRTASKHRARVSAEIGGRVISRPVHRGDRVSTGDLLCELALDDRPALVAEAEAQLQRAEIEFRGAQELKERDLLSEIRIAQVAAELESARARLARERLSLARARITAPFGGIVEELLMDIGDLAALGTGCATLLDLDPLLITASVSERDIGVIVVGSSVNARTSSGQALEGKITFVGSESDLSTRTYPVEITVPNPDYRLRAGLTTVVSVVAETVLAHRVSPSLFTLNDAGVIGLRAVDDDQRVVFHPIAIVEDAAGGAWVTGLPGVVRLITVGQEFVSAGQLVETQNAAGLAGTASRQ